jgi:alpha-amylase
LSRNSGATLALMLIALVLLAACRRAPETEVAVNEPAFTPFMGILADTDGYPWWNDAVFYEVFVRSFYDSDGDGVGDIQGLIEKLDYLNDGDPNTATDLGVTGLWLMPITQSASYHGYDVVDYFQVDDEYGSHEEFRQLMAEAHARGMRVIIDLVLNHTGYDHPWFAAAQEPGDEYRDWYLWQDEAPNYRGPWGQEVWHYTGDEYYYGVFWEGMPDLNLENPATTNRLYEAARFWLEDMGADGFRLDAIKHLIEDAEVQENTPETHAWLQQFHLFYKEVDPEALAVGEAWTVTSEVVDYIGDEVDIAFEFDLAAAIINSVKDGRRDGLAAAYEKVVATYPAGQYAPFLTNHDQNRVMSQLANDLERAKVAASILLTSPGVPFLYYGEEIGLRGIKPDEDIRRPMQWSAAKNAGFTTGEPWRPPHQTYPDFNVAGQTDDPDSLLSHYRALIHLRNQTEALRVGGWLLVNTHNDDIFTFLRFTDDEAILVIINLDDVSITDFELNLASGPFSGELSASVLLGSGQAATPTLNAAGGFAPYQPLSELPPFSTAIIRLVP